MNATDLAALNGKEIPNAGLMDERVRTLVPGFDMPFFQAGLAGYSDGAMRLIARQEGCPYCVTEALLDQCLVTDNNSKRQDDPNAVHLEVSEQRVLRDQPLAGQIMGSDPDTMTAAALILVQKGYAVIDLNFACPVKKVQNRSRGGHLLTEPEAALDVVRAVRAALPSTVPLSLKLRRSFDDTEEMARNFDELLEGAFAAGVAWATIHGRTVVQKYRGPADWSALAAIVAHHPDKVLFGSGDIETPQDVVSMLEQTGVRAVAVARGGIGNPWIFRQARQLLLGQPVTQPHLVEQYRALTRHFELCKVLYGPKKALLHMRKFTIQYTKLHPQGKSVLRTLTTCETAERWRALVDELYLAHD